MNKKILIISGSPKKNGNTAVLIKWFSDAAEAQGAKTKIIQAGFLKSRTNGCISCRMCQKRKEYGCVLDDDVKQVIDRMIESDVIVFATPLYFFSASAQTKIVLDRMFSLYKWDNAAGTMETILKGKMLVVIASAFEAEGLDVLEKPFAMTAEYSGMKYVSLLVPNAGVSGEINKIADIQKKTEDFGRRIAET